ncbi:MAG: serine hydrolase domain-containing protein [Crocinitomicaceae bacterium]
MNRILILIVACIMLVGCSNEASENSIYSIVVSKNGQIVKEEYYNGSAKNELFNTQSVSKSIISLLVGIAIDQSFIKSEESLIFEYFPESTYFSNEQKKEITIKHLLNHTSGLDWKGFLEHETFLASKNQAEYVLGRDIISKPGLEYNYHSGGTHLLSFILTKATGMTTLEFAKQYLFKPLEIENVEWEKLNDGYYDGAGFGLLMRSDDLLKIGELLLNEGKYDSQQIVSKTWIQKSFDERLKKDTKWGLRHSQHGYGWYSKMNGEEQILYAMGYGGQFIFIMPKKELVIVTTHNHDTPDGIDQQVDFLDGILGKLVDEYGR